MCGRYYVDDDTAREMEAIIRRIDTRKIKEGGFQRKLQAKDTHPTEEALVLAASGQELCCKWQRWGLPKYAETKQVIFNARSETVLEKQTFREGMQQRRVVIPAAWFYEWSRKKEKNIFYVKTQPVLFMAGLYNRYQDEERFVILTTEANDSMRPVHDRMPLILEADEIIPWIFDQSKAEDFLHKTPGLLERRTEYEQFSLFPGT